MSFKAVILLSRRADMSPAEFTSWWLNEHAPLAAGLPGARRVVFNTVDDTTEIDGISELWFDTKADFEAAYATPLGQAVAADSIAHVRRRVRLFVEENVVVPGAE